MFRRGRGWPWRCDTLSFHRMHRRTFLLTSLALERAAHRACAQSVATPRLPIFRDVTARSRIDFHCQGSPASQKYLIETMPAGVAMFDYDGDGFLDLYFVNGAELDYPMPPGNAPDKSDPRLLEPALPQQRRRHLHRRDRPGWRAAALLRHGRGGRRLRQRRPPGPLCHQYRPQHSLSQQRRRHLHRRDRESRCGGRRLVLQRLLGSTTTTMAGWT